MFKYFATLDRVLEILLLRAVTTFNWNHSLLCLKQFINELLIQSPFKFSLTNYFWSYWTSKSFCCSPITNCFCFSWHLSKWHATYHLIWEFQLHFSHDSLVLAAFRPVMPFLVTLCSNRNSDGTKLALWCRLKILIRNTSVVSLFLILVMLPLCKNAEFYHQGFLISIN